MYYVFDNEENRFVPFCWDSFDAIQPPYRGTPRYTVYQKMVGDPPPL